MWSGSGGKGSEHGLKEQTSNSNDGSNGHNAKALVREKKKVKSEERQFIAEMQLLRQHLQATSSGCRWPAEVLGTGNVPRGAPRRSAKEGR